MSPLTTTGMRVLSVDRYGPPEVVAVAVRPRPVAGVGEVLVRVHAVCVTSADSAARSGRPQLARLAFGLVRPRQPVLGTEFAGVIESVGEGVTTLAVGDRVVAASGAQFGAHAEYVVVAAAGAIAIVPEGVALGDALAICEGGLTALPFLRDEARLASGQRILVNGASGSVGSAAVQLARLMGADVTAVCSAPNAALVAGLGAARVIDYRSDDFTRSTERFDVVFDAVGASSFARCRRVLTPGGSYLTTVPSPAILLHGVVARLSGLRARLALTGLRPPAAKRADLDRLLGHAATGDLVAVIDSRYPLDGAVEAYRRVDSGRKRGSVVLDLVAD